ncbi:hypothetical protein EW145_g3822 [Phellinidium pouzarii]|uniref:Uncharacterized protein n=1 Tax=Phellinidium pouzarii TaxID=167371 RepID=A0A4V3XCQ6_9AGAM|nr:hypothetical protein EW145_g3822 [Phellinidium pouzarii]
MSATPSSSSLPRSKSTSSPFVEGPTDLTISNLERYTAPVRALPSWNGMLIAKARAKSAKSMLIGDWAKANGDADAVQRDALEDRREQQALDIYVATANASATQRRVISEDPFNLAGFFPSRPGSPEPVLEWARRSTTGEAAPQVIEELAPPRRSLSMNALDEYARAVIAKESRFGILGLVHVPSFLKSIGESYFAETEEEEQEPLGMTLDEPFDAETLHESMHLRRIASEQALAVHEVKPSFSLFTPTSAPRPEEEEASTTASHRQRNKQEMRTLHEFVSPFLPSSQDPFHIQSLSMAAVAANDRLQHSPGPADPSQQQPDLSILVHSLTSSPLTHQDSNTNSSQILSRPPSANPAQGSAALDPPSSLTQDSVSQVQQQAQMAIQSILATAQRKGREQQPAWSLNDVTLPPDMAAQVNGQPSSSKRRLEDPDDDDPHAKIRRTVQEHVQHENDRVMNMTTVVCLHAAVAQKSYGSEKRFLCPPPLVRIEGPFGNIRDQKLSMCIVSETGERAPEAVVPLDPNLTASFKFLHVTGTAKAKSFNLSLQISPPHQPGVSYPEGELRPRSWAVFESAPVTIISKPSKKTAKTRNISSCILAGGPVSLFNRINSQTVRTKYMTIDHAHLPQEAGPVAGPQPVTYGSEIVLSDSMTGITTAPLVIRKVDKGKISNEDGGPVSQMQKIALQRVNPDGSRHYLSAAGPVPGTPGVVAPPAPGSQAGTHHLLFQSPRVREEVKEGVRTVHDEVDDYLCWTIVGIWHNNKIPDLPITPFPTLFQPPVYRPTSNTLDLTVSSFFYENPKTGHHSQLEIWIGDIGPLQHRVGNALPSGPLTNIASFYDPHGPPPSGSIPPADASAISGSPTLLPIPQPFIPTGPFHTNVTVDMPPVQDIVKTLQKEARRQLNAANATVEDGLHSGDSTPDPAINITGRSLPLLFIRGADGVGYHSGRTITCENVFQGMDLSNPPAGPGGGPDPAWLAAAQAATADGGMHGWTLRVL